MRILGRLLRPEIQRLAGDARVFLPLSEIPAPLVRRLPPVIGTHGDSPLLSTLNCIVPWEFYYHLTGRRKLDVDRMEAKIRWRLEHLADAR